MLTMTPQDRQIHQQFSQYGQNTREWMRKCVLLFPEIERREIWKKKRCGSIYEYAARLAGMSRAMVDEALWVLKKVEDKAELMKIVQEKGLRRVRPLVSIATKETESFWAEKARVMSRSTLETYVKNYRLELIPGNKPLPEKRTIALELPLALAQRLEQAQKRADFIGEIEIMLSKLEAKEKEEQRKVVSKANSKLMEAPSRHMPTQVKRHVLQRTDGLCAYPRCIKPATSLHHTQRWALEKVHDPQRLHGLCTPHERLAHLGLIEHEEESPQKWRLLREADRSAFKTYVDQFVGLYRPT